ncbi:MAG: hypothetical protein Fur0041_10750 [Bacteroidia bacterium]
MTKISTRKKLQKLESEDIINFAAGEFNEEPGQHVIDALLRYSRSLQVKKSASVGFIETVGN